jgi:hypothetical protein
VRGLSQRRQNEPPATDGVPGVVVRLIDGSPLSRRARANLLRRLSVMLGGSARRAGAAGVASGRWLTEMVEEFAPHVPIRDYETLRAHYDGATGDALARALIDNAARATAAVGAAGGVLSTVEFTAPPTLLTTPVQVAAETIAVVAIELKLVAELHEVYGRIVAGTPAVKTAAYLGAWTRRRGIDPFSGGPGVTAVVSGAARRELRRRLMRRAGGQAATVMPFMAGAVAGASLNSRETKKLGEKIARDLGAHHL